MRRLRLPLVWAVALTLTVGARQVDALEIQDVRLKLNPSGNAPLAALCTFTTDVPTRANVSVTDGKRIFAPPQNPDFQTNHEIIILGLYPESTYEVTIAVVNEAGARVLSSSLELETAPLPELTPRIKVRVNKSGQMEPGFTFIPLMYWPQGGMSDEYGYLLAVDNDGQVVWYYQPEHHVTEIRRARNGNLLYQSGRAGHLYEIDMLGNILHHWYASGTPKDVEEGAIPVATDTFHHDFFEMPNGNILTLSTEYRTLKDYPSSESNMTAEPEDSIVIGDVIVEHTRTGEIVRQHKTLDILDPYRLGFGSLGTGFYAAAYEGVLDEPGRDWLHTNSIFYDPSDDSVVMSSYHLDQVYKLDMDTGEIKWILGNHDDWKAEYKPYLLEPKGDLSWTYHQHAAKITPQGTILIFDNGTNRGSRPGQKKPPSKESYSRAVEFKVDAEAMEVEQLWHYGGPDGERFFSSFICDVDWMPETGNVLITDGGRTRTREGGDGASPFAGQHWARIVEVTHATPSEKVWELTVDDELPKGWAIYRSERLPSLYR